MTDYTDPHRSLRLLQRLRELGFTDDDFARLHHSRDRRRATIRAHLRYCLVTTRFRTGGNNARLQQKLEQELARRLADEDPGPGNRSQIPYSVALLPGATQASRSRAPPPSTGTWHRAGRRPA